MLIFEQKKNDNNKNKFIKWKKKCTFNSLYVIIEKNFFFKKSFQTKETPSDLFFLQLNEIKTGSR